MNDHLERKLKMMYKLQKEIDELNYEKTKLRIELEDAIKDAQLENKKFSVGDRSISYVRRTTTQPLTNKYMADILKSYYKNNDRANETYQYIMDHRKKSTKYQLEILRKKQNPK